MTAISCVLNPRFFIFVSIAGVNHAAPTLFSAESVKYRSNPLITLLLPLIILLAKNFEY